MNNKLKTHWLFAALLVSCCTSLWGQPFQTMFLKDGSELNGYISMQRPGENFIFSTQRAQIIMSGKSVTSIIDKEVAYKELSEPWKKWATENDAYVGMGDNRVLVLSDIVTAKSTIEKVRILEKGAKIRYLELSPNTYSLSWDTIAVVKVSNRNRSQLTGINRIYKLASGMEYEGQYVEEVPGKTLSLYRENGIVEVFETKDVIKDIRRKVNPNQSLLEQSEWVDLIKLKNGDSYRGVIFERNYNTDSGNYLLIQLANEAIQSVKMDQIKEYLKEVNPDYKCVYDILLRENELVINRTEIHRLTATENDEGTFVFIPSDTSAVVIQKGQDDKTITVETNMSETALSFDYKLIKVKKIYLDKRKKEVGFGFSYENLAKNSVQPTSSETSKNHTTKIIYKPSENGLYALFNPQDMTMIPFIIE